MTVTLPEVFVVGAAVKRAHGGGKLTVNPGMLILELGPLTRRYTNIDRVVHTTKRVAMFKGRLLPPFLNTRLVIDDGDVVAVASLPGWSRQRLRAAIREAGLELAEESGWFV
jgi:hypothetical protein